MSGFVAIINLDGTPVNKGLLEKLTGSLDHRGPDARRIWAEGSIGLGHTLFQATRPSKYEHQPSSLNGDVWIVANARIDARQELAGKLILDNNIPIESIPDSELILRAYHKWGEECLGHLLGDFAFVIWDSRKRRLFCGRDRFGMRQLNYSQRNQSLVISNSTYCMLQHPSISKRVNEQAMGDYLLLGDHTWFDKSITAFADIQTLPPAHTLIAALGKVSVKRYWEFPLEVPLCNYKEPIEYVEHFNSVFKFAVGDRLNADRVVVSMSGGLDSTSIAAVSKEVQQEKGNPVEINAITSIYNEIHPCEEKTYAELAANYIGINTHFISADEYAFMGSPEPTTRPMGMIQPTLWLDMYKKSSELGRVLLAGHAADNLLAFTSMKNQDWKEINVSQLFVELLSMFRKYGKFPNIGTGILGKMRGFRHGGGINNFPAYPAPEWINKDFEKRLHLKERWGDFVSHQSIALNSRHPKIHVALKEPSWNVDDMCMVSDFTIPEECDPFLDLRVIEFVLSMPPLPWLFDKHILRSAMTNKLPEGVVKRHKTSLGSIHTSFLKQPGMQWIDEWNPIAEMNHFIEREKVPKLAGAAFNRNGSYTDLLPMGLNNWLQGLSNLEGLVMYE